MEKEKNVSWKNSIQTRQTIGFSVIIIFMIISSLILQTGAVDLAAETTYEKMKANAEYFVEAFESEMAHVHQLQMNFFSDRKLTFLESSLIQIDDYERREALLSVKERLQTITGVSSLVEEGILCLPETDYWITSSRIRRMEEEDLELMEHYLSLPTGKLYDDGSEFYIAETGMISNVVEDLPRHILVIKFSPEAIQEKLSALNTDIHNGAFFYREDSAYILSGGQNELETEICRQLKKDEDGEYLPVQRLKANGEWYLICSAKTSEMGVFIQYAKEAPIMENINYFRYMMVVIVVLMILMSVVFIWYMRRLIHRPIRILLSAFAKLEEGDWSVNIRHIGNDEFGRLYVGFNHMKERISNLIEEVYVQKNLTQRAQLKQLQAQINPHFLYNSFFILSRRIKREDYENARTIADHLGEYFRFLTRNESDYIPLKKEVDHARCYCEIQAARFAGRIEVQFAELPKDAEEIKVPRLILQPLLENVFGHGLYNKEENGIARVSFCENEEDVLVLVEDNGDELTEEGLNRMKECLRNGDDGEEITGIINIHKRLNFYFKGKGGLEIRRSELGGLCVTVRIAKEEVEHGTEFADR